MKLDTGTTLKTLEGEPLQNGEKDLTLGAVCIEALLSTFKDELALSGEQKLRRYRLASRISRNAQCNLSSEDTALVKQLVAKAYGPLAVGQVWDLLEGTLVQNDIEPDSEEKTDKEK